jgi:hypothetical protein
MAAAKTAFEHNFIETSGWKLRPEDRRGKPYAFQDYFRNAIQTYIFS